jgi:two-component system, NarL family, sensor kinase
MKFFKAAILRFFLSCIIGYCPLQSGATPVPIDPSKLTFLKDSIRRLDSLVQETKEINSPLAIEHARKALSYSRALKTPQDLIHGYRLMGQAFFQKDKDSSYVYFSRALRLADSIQDNSEKPYLVYIHGLLYYFAKDYKTSIILLDSCVKLSEIQKDYSRLSQAYNILGNIYMDIKNRDVALTMYDSANQIARRHLIYPQIGISLGNLARFENDPVKALKLERAAILYLKKSKGSEDGLAKSYVNIGFRASNPDTAIYYFNEALRIAKSNHLWETELSAYNNMVYSLLDKGNLKEAEACLVDFALPLARKEKNDDWLASLSDTYSDVLIRKGDFKNAVKWQKTAMEKRISADKAKASEQVRLLGVLLDLKSKDYIIQDKQKEILLQQNRLQKTRLGLTITIFMIIGFLFVILWLQQRNRVKLQVQQINSAKRIIEMEENEKGNIARELHDITGQLVMGITGEIENLDLPDSGIKDEIKVKIKELGKSIRLISHRMNKATLEHFTFEELIFGQCDDMRKATGLQIQLEMSEEFGDLNEEIVLHAYRIVQELLTNAGKYARESLVRIIFLRTTNEMILTYSDDGPGFDSKLIEKKGMGLMNVFERARLINGTAKLNSSPGNGTFWEIIIPLIPRKTKYS